VAGAKKRLDAEITEGRFDDGLGPAPPVSEQRKAAVPSRKADKPERATSKGPAQPTLLSVAEPPVPVRPASSDSSSAPSGLDRKSVVRELKDIVRLLDRARPK